MPMLPTVGYTHNKKIKLKNRKFTLDSSITCKNKNKKSLA